MSRNNIIFIFIIMILIALLAIFAFNFISDSNVDYYVDDVGGYSFNIPDFLIFESEDSTNISYGKIYSNEQISLAIIVRKDINLSKDELLDEYNVTNCKNVKFGNLQGYKTSKLSSVTYYFKINSDLILISFVGSKNTDILVEKMLKNIS